MTEREIDPISVDREREKERERNHKKEISFHEDILLVRTTQESYGRKQNKSNQKITPSLFLSPSPSPSLSPSPSPSLSLSSNTHQNILKNNKSRRHLITTNPSPSPSLSLPHSHSHSSHQIKKNSFQFHSKFLQNNEENEIQKVQQSFQQNLKEITQKKQKLILSFNQNFQSQNYLSIILQMPNVINILFHLNHSIQLLKLSEGFKKWKQEIEKKKFYEKRQLLLRQKTLQKTRFLWLQSYWRSYLYQYRRKKNNLERIYRSTCARIIQRFFRSVIFWKRKFQEHSHSLHQMNQLFVQNKQAIKIQRIYRGWRESKIYIDRWRCVFVKEMREWGHGNIQNLAERDSESISVINSPVYRPSSSSCLSYAFKSSCTLQPSFPSLTLVTHTLQCATNSTGSRPQDEFIFRSG
jgi:hypothetical protein